jgi:hypothetical protein
MEETTALWGTLGTVAGVLAAVVLFLLALWFVARARQGNRRVREARHDPHVDHGADGDGSELAQEDRRDISQ